MEPLNRFVFGIYPYICLAVFLLGSIVRFEREQYTWKSDSSQLLRRGTLRLGSNLFHVGILLLFAGHLVGLLTPHAALEALGVSPASKQMFAITAGSIAGAACFAGVVLLFGRRLEDARLRATTRPMDVLVLAWLLATVSIGLVSIPFSLQHRDGSVMLALMDWAQHIATFRPDASRFVLGVPVIYRVHLFFGLTLFLLFPFSRLVHVWSGFAALAYVWRPPQIVRTR